MFSNRKIEKYLFFMLAIQVLGFLYFISFFKVNSYLPSPFVFDKFDTFQDLYNSMIWTQTNRMYSEWHSVYPPFVFFLLKVFSSLTGYMNNLKISEERILNTNILSLYLVWAFISPILIMNFEAWKNVKFNQKALIYFIFILSPVFLFTLERANLVIIAPFFLAFFLNKNSFIKIVSAAILINIKPNYIFLLLFFALKKDWKLLASTISLSGFFFLIFGIFSGDNILNFIRNLFLFHGSQVISFPNQFIASGNLFGIVKVINNNLFLEALRNFSGFDFNLLSKALGWFFLAIIFLVTSVMLLKVFLAKPDLVNQDLLNCFIVLMILNLGSFNMLYNLITIFPLLPYLLKLNDRYILISLFVIFASFSFFYFDRDGLMIQYSFIARDYVRVGLQLTIQSLLLPVFNFLLFLRVSRKIINENKTT
jgi:hypothetical protein